MKQFNYTAKDATGKLIRDTYESETRQSALSELRRRGLTVVSLMEQESHHSSLNDRVRETTKVRRKTVKETDDLTLSSRKTFKSARIRLSDMAVFCRQLAISVNSGLSLREALEGIYEDMDIAPLKRILNDIIRKLHDGIQFSRAVADHPRVFSPVFIGMIRAAEEAGSLPETLDRLAAYMESSDKLRRKIKSLMAYPAFVAGFFVLICLVMVLAIIPRFQKIFGDLNSELPKFTQAVFSVNNYIVTHFILIVGVFALLLAGYILYGRTKHGGLQIARVKLDLPVSGSCLKRYIIARVCRCLSIMLKSGVPVSTALKIVAKIGDNLAIEQALIDAHSKIISGSSIAAGLSHSNIFPALLIRMLNVGESAGKLPDVLDRVSDAYEDQVEAAITTSTALLEPVIITIFGMMVLLLIISIYLPVFTVAAHVR